MSVVYIYQSCLPVATFSTKKTQVIQSEKVSITYYPGLTFKDLNNICWTYLGEYENSYIPPQEVFSLTYQGNFFEKNTLLSQIYYPTCDYCVVTQVSACTEVYFVGERCDDNTDVIVMACNVGPTEGNLKLTPTIGDVCGIINPDGDDFCVTIKSQVSDVTTDYNVGTPAWNSYDCDSCPIYKVYSVSEINGLPGTFKVSAPKTSETLLTGTSVNLNVNPNCYIINSYDGIKVNYLYNSDVNPTINQVFATSADCAINYYNTII
jgi:hypothetical protein